MPELPLVSIVTPSYNQVQFLEATVRSVIDQDYPRLEYIIIDGNSRDGSIDVIRSFNNRLAYWVSEPDQGQYEAINKGFARSAGEIMGWINSDDMYVPGALAVVGEIFATHPEIEWLTSLHPITWDSCGRAVACFRYHGYDLHAFLRGEYLPGRRWFATGWIQQESTFWRRSLWERAGGHLDVSFRLAADFELWARFFQAAELYGVDTVLGGFRLHAGQKTAHQLEAYCVEAEKALRLHGGRPSGRVASILHVGLARYCPPPLRRTLPFLSAYRVCRYAGRDGGWLVARG